MPPMEHNWMHVPWGCAVASMGQLFWSVCIFCRQHHLQTLYRTVRVYGVYCFVVWKLLEVIPREIQHSLLWGSSLSSSCNLGRHIWVLWDRHLVRSVSVRENVYLRKNKNNCLEIVAGVCLLLEGNKVGCALKAYIRWKNCSLCQ